MREETVLDLSVIIVSYNTRVHLARCLSAIPPAARDLVTEIIVVDNGSTDGTQAMVAQKFPHVRLIQNQENLGFGRANNLGARASRWRALLFLNSDCDLQSGSLPIMMEVLKEDGSVAIVFCRLQNPDGSLQPSVHSSFPSLWQPIGDIFLLSSLRYALYRRPRLHAWFLRRTLRAHARRQDVAWGGGACMLVQRAAFDAIGGFDERFFMYCEDMDLCKRAKGAGYRLSYVPEACAIHHWGKSTAQLPVLMLSEAYRSRLYYWQKHFPGWRATTARWLVGAELALRRTVFGLLAMFPTRHRLSLRERARASASCVEILQQGRAGGTKVSTSSRKRP